MAYRSKRQHSGLKLTLLLLVLALVSPAPVSAQACPATSTAILRPQNSGVSGTVTLGAPINNTFTVTATINGLLPGSAPTLTIPTLTGVMTTVGGAAGTAPVGGPVNIN